MKPQLLFKEGGYVRLHEGILDDGTYTVSDYYGVIVGVDERWRVLIDWTDQDSPAFDKYPMQRLELCCQNCIRPWNEHVKSSGKCLFGSTVWQETPCP